MSVFYEIFHGDRLVLGITVGLDHRCLGELEIISRWKGGLSETDWIRWIVLDPFLPDIIHFWGPAYIFFAHHTCICDWIFIFDTLMWLLRKKSRTPCPHIETGVRLITQWSKAMRSYKVTVRVFKSNTPNWKRRLKSIFCFSNKGRPQGSIPTASPVKLDTVLP